jgi:hypothetical protein
MAIGKDDELSGGLLRDRLLRGLYWAAGLGLAPALATPSGAQRT